MLDPDLPVPLWIQLAEIIRGRISDGTYPGQLPSAKTLAQEHEVSHKTSEHALSSLRDEGLIVAVQGKGYFVRR